MASSAPNQPQDAPSGPAGPPCPAHIHILIGKVRRPQHQQQQQKNSGATPPPPPQYDSLWATFPMCRSTISYEGFQAAVSASANEAVAAAQQQHPEDKAAVTVFSPIGQYTVHHVTPQPPNTQPGHFNPPPTSLLTHPYRRTPPDPKQPIWVDFYIHSTPQPQPQPTDPNTQTRFTTELHHRLQTLDPRLSNGPSRSNTLDLSEIPAAALQATPPDDDDDGGVALTLPPISRRDWACAVEMHLLSTTLNGHVGPPSPSPSPSPQGGTLQQLMEEAVTQLGRLRDDGPGRRLRRESFEELLRCLGEGGLCLTYAEDAVAAELEGALRGGGGGTAVGGGDGDHVIDSQPIPREPGFPAVMMAFLNHNFSQMMQDERRVSLQEAWARARLSEGNRG